MSEVSDPKVWLIGWPFSSFPEHIPWETDAGGAEAVSEFAGRLCYESWNKPNPNTATNEGYLRNIIAQGHESVLEHGVFTFYIEGVSRSLTHELIRHRHLSFSELSQRYVNMEDARIIHPPACVEHTEAHVKGVGEANKEAYQALEECMHATLPEGLTKREARKRSREAARSVLTNAIETKLVVSGNARAWRHVLLMRGSLHADAEIRRLAIELCYQLKEVAPNLFQDLYVETNSYGDTGVYQEALPGR